MARGSRSDKSGGRGWLRGRKAAEPDAGAAAPAAQESTDVVVVDGRPEYHRSGCRRLEGLAAEVIPLSQAVEDGFTPCLACSPPGAPAGPAVWVVDGSPEYHEESCRTLSARDAEPIPLAQAVEDGFSPCTVCSPPLPPGSAERDAQRQVWVVDGLPDYHREGCDQLTDRDALAIPYDQAVEDGFRPCVVCRPDEEAVPAADAVGLIAEPVAERDVAAEPEVEAEREPVGAAGAGAAEPDVAAAAGEADVWVVDGEPEYHRPDCIRIVGLNSEPIPREQAVEDGFVECSTCTPDAAAPPGIAPERSIPPAVEPEPELPAAFEPEPTFAAEPVSDRLGAAEAPVSLPPEPLAEEPAAAAVGGSGAAEREVWVADGYPDYHNAGCHELNGLDSEPIPLSQAVEDGFAPCGVCRPDRDEAPVPVPSAAPVAADVSEVWVVDGFPNYHRSGCVELAGLDAELIDREQAVEDGFQPCPICQPDVAAAPEAPAAVPEPSLGIADEPAAEPAAAFAEPDAAAAAPLGGEPLTPEVPAAVPEPAVAAPEPALGASGALSEVWVADGYPDYHREGCVELIGLRAETIPHDQAVEDGFAPCAVCQPDAAAPAAGLAPEPTEAAAQPGGAAGFGAAAEPEPLAAEPLSQGESLAGLEPFGQPEPEPTPGAGFEPAAAGSPDALVGQEAAQESPQVPTGVLAEVWVADGYPDYHREGCVELIGLDAETIPHDQAVEDGFAPCAVCRPEAVEAPTATTPAAAAPAEPATETVADVPAAAEVGTAGALAAEVGTAGALAAEVGTAGALARPDEVWVADGYPDFHLPGCRELAGLDAEPIPFDQAVEDDFQPCEVCRPHEPGAVRPEDYLAPAAVGVSEAEPAATAEPLPEPEPSLAEPAVPAEPEPAVTVEPLSEPEPSLPEPAAAAEPLPEPEPAVAPEPAPAAAAEQEPTTAPEPEPAAAAEPLAEPLPAATAEPLAEPAPAVAPEPEPAVAPEPEPAVAPEPEPAVTPEPEPAAAGYGLAEPSIEPVREPVAASVGAVSVETAGAASGSARRVWVVDGRPRYHAQDCLIIKGQKAQPIPFDEAVEDGFMPCSLCQRKR